MVTKVENDNVFSNPEGVRCAARRSERKALMRFAAISVCESFTLMESEERLVDARL